MTSCKARLYQEQEKVANLAGRHLHGCAGFCVDEQHTCALMKAGGCFVCHSDIVFLLVIYCLLFVTALSSKRANMGVVCDHVEYFA